LKAKERKANLERNRGHGDVIEDDGRRLDDDGLELDGIGVDGEGGDLDDYRRHGHGGQVDSQRRHGDGGERHGHGRSLEANHNRDKVKSTVIGSVECCIPEGARA
jgi:hypothetical protein